MNCKAGCLICPITLYKWHRDSVSGARFDLSDDGLREAWWIRHGWLYRDCDDESANRLKLGTRLQSLSIHIQVQYYNASVITCLEQTSRRRLKARDRHAGLIYVDEKKTNYGKANSIRLHGLCTKAGRIKLSIWVKDWCVGCSSLAKHQRRIKSPNSPTCITDVARGQNLYLTLNCRRLLFIFIGKKEKGQRKTSLC